MKTKQQRRNEARVTAEKMKAARKAERLKKRGDSATMTSSKKGKSLVPQSKSGRRK